MNSVKHILGIHHVTVQAGDIEESLRLYRDVLGMAVVAEFGAPERRIFLLEAGSGSHVELFAPTGDTPAPGSPAANDPLVHIALAATDTASATERVRGAGYTITVEPKTVDLPGMAVTISFFEGPNGEVIELFQVH
jgi:catechol 2,3-dioxygenase-like lactoylglutathione lyase family enzyme